MNRLLLVRIFCHSRVSQGSDQRACANILRTPNLARLSLRQRAHYGPISSMEKQNYSRICDRESVRQKNTRLGLQIASCPPVPPSIGHVQSSLVAFYFIGAYPADLCPSVNRNTRTAMAVMVRIPRVSAAATSELDLADWSPAFGVRRFRCCWRLPLFRRCCRRAWLERPAKDQRSYRHH